ncbi:AAA family ATPase [Halobiforma nitratireducens JCM 10879]|uniref:AAA family ATPase n=1 Tax=Halobiforma nitratireducens JCM 10879 TaxID=1227454 RepID=M0LLS2_9EURY|nr:AAA family ATPase [Halobiforma nitratireducens JCM 10879]
MAAEIIASETGLDLYRVDLSQIVNKYIGETESRLAALLEEAERSNAILLFDEADSLFGERTDVGDSTDRYANNVTNFLLQRLEAFDGIALLTTNKRSGIDAAFKRRIAHSIHFDAVAYTHLDEQALGDRRGVQTSNRSLDPLRRATGAYPPADLAGGLPGRSQCRHRDVRLRIPRPALADAGGHSQGREVRRLHRCYRNPRRPPPRGVGGGLR